MKTARSGRDGPVVSRLGIGGWQASGPGPWGSGPKSDDDAAIAAIRHAVERGMTWVDTAASYGLGHSEEVVARALSPWRVGEEVLVFTKCGHPWEPPDRIRTDLRPSSIRAECEGSLRRLGVDRIDLYQFHHADPTVPVEESWGSMVELVDEGKVRWAGVSNFDVALLDRCETIAHVDALQPELSLVRPRSRSDVIPWCVEHGTGVIVYSPIATGMLSGVDRSSVESSVDEAISQVARDLVEGLRPIASRMGVTVAALAVAWTLSTDGVTGAICGARTAHQADGWLPAGDLALDPRTIDAIESLLAGSRR